MQTDKKNKWNVLKKCVEVSATLDESDLLASQNFSEPLPKLLQSQQWRLGNIDPVGQITFLFNAGPPVAIAVPPRPRTKLCKLPAGSPIS